MRIRVQPEPVPETTRRYPRTLAEAFKQSEGYRRAGWYYPAPAPLMDRISWFIVIGLASWLLWIAYHAPKVT